MEDREDLKSILPFIPLMLRSSTLCWPSKTVESLKALSRGPQVSEVDSGAILFDAIVDLRDSIGLSKERLSQYTADGYALFFDDLIDRLESRKWFGEVVPFLANLLLQLPSLLENHYQISDSIFAKENNGSTTRTGLRVLDSQEAGIVFMSQELIGALLACSFFCLFPTLNRGSKHLPFINFDDLFVCLYANGGQSQEQKIKCIIHYFERISLSMPVGFVSFERKVLPLKQSLGGTVYPDADFWSKSVSPLCSFKVANSGLIEDQQYDALEIDFANKYIGGGALSAGCVQEEIRFMVNPELIISMLFLPSMEDNEAIEIIGAERFSKYTGYSSSFRFSGDYLDKKPRDPIGRRKTRIVAIDALCYPGKMQYQVEGLLRETNKAFCGFLGHSNNREYKKPFHALFCQNKFCKTIDGGSSKALSTCPAGDDSIPISTGTGVVDSSHSPHFDEQLKPPAYYEPNMASTERTKSFDERSQDLGNEENSGIATGNWGCGAFGGNPELKSTIQWLAASQAQRPFVLYFTFNDTALRRLEEVSQWILSQGWTVGDLWNMLLEYSSQRSKGQTDAGFFSWLLPTLPEDHVVLTNVPD